MQVVAKVAAVIAMVLVRLGGQELGHLLLVVKEVKGVKADSLKFQSLTIGLLTR
jgi:hypothetical protein